MDNNKTQLDSGIALIKALSEASAYQHKVTAFSLVETHISWVLLTGKYAYKIKKPVNFGFLDFSTLEKRRFFCHEEIRLNRRLAPDLYLDVVAITGSPDQPTMEGGGAVIEYAVKMLQFPAGFTLSELAESGQLTVNEIDQITGIVADFHDVIEKADIASPYGQSEGIKHWFNENFDHIRPLLVDEKQKQQLQVIETWGNDEWHDKAELMELRRGQGYIRECHGDLHLSNMTLINGKVTLFDCIEFNPLLRWIDVISELAFLVIDLLHVGYECYAYRLLNHYLQHSGDYQGLALLRYYLVYRALVCAKVSLLRNAQQLNDPVCNQPCLKYLEFVTLAERFTTVKPVVLIITHGYSGSGKSTYAGQLAEKMGALQIRSDIERKRLFGYQAQSDTGSDLDSGLYTREAGHKTYLHLAGCAKNVIKAGFSAIVDAAFLKADQRDLFKNLAAECGVRFIIVDFKASTEALCRRIKQRQNDASEATTDVLLHQLQWAEVLSAEEQINVITVNTESDKALDSLFNCMPTNH
ncbi:bifunctional aminoglycoside phosphotransferase/ATP-binding protein [Methylobacter psychrophilus]|uniref:bifunctional aminoglycoside phosphotransferase/ATP-binding protein n=1 Tax=Methylobacter psychrophilus TaxID=96941 RepID=UPI0021D4C9F2|nr:bifunctional aminoglycoside phosphotransferase/ATP-binding protein [Methylobacter psychrophilus]